MSKSLGTGIDPMKVIETIGADAMRYTLLSQTGENQDLRYSEKKTEEARNFCNKLWNATRFVLMNVSGPVQEPTQYQLEEVDRWLLSRLHRAIRESKAGYLQFDIQSTCQALYTFFWSELCDWYIEVAKPRLADEATKAVPQWVLLTALESFFIAMHPVMPFITEELYGFIQNVKGNSDASLAPEERGQGEGVVRNYGKASYVMNSRWPQLPEWFDQPESEARIERAFEITRALRALRAELGVDPMKAVRLAMFEGDLQGCEFVVSSQGWVSELLPGRPVGQFASANVSGVTLHLPLTGLVDREKELARAQKELTKAEDERARLAAKFENPQFVERAKPEVIERDRQALADLDSRVEKVRERMALFT